MINCTEPKFNHGIDSIIEIEHFSSLQRLFRVTCYVIRFIKNILSKVNESPNSFITGIVSSEELAHCKKLWILNEQKVIYELKSFDNLRKSLSLYIDDDGILRLRGRLANSTCDNDFKYPIYLRNDSYFTKLLILYCHEYVLHNGLNCTLNYLRNVYCICKGRKTVKKSD